jgi:hypothetical protein
MITKYKTSLFHLKKISKLPVDLVVGDVCSVVVTSVTVGLGNHQLTIEHSMS